MKKILFIVLLITVSAGFVKSQSVKDSIIYDHGVWSYDSTLFFCFITEDIVQNDSSLHFYSGNPHSSIRFSPQETFPIHTVEFNYIQTGGFADSIKCYYDNFQDWIIFENCGFEQFDLYFLKIYYYKSTASIQELNFNSELKLIGIYDLTGREIKKNDLLLDHLYIYRFENGYCEKKIFLRN
jgi:hypothetical protein